MFVTGGRSDRMPIQLIVGSTQCSATSCGPTHNRALRSRLLGACTLPLQSHLRQAQRHDSRPRGRPPSIWSGAKHVGIATFTRAGSALCRTTFDALKALSRGDRRTSGCLAAVGEFLPWPGTPVQRRRGCCRGYEDQEIKRAVRQVGISGSCRRMRPSDRSSLRPVMSTRLKPIRRSRPTIYIVY